MYLPEAVLYCIQTLQNAGFEAYAVGGCVRDHLLGIIPHDYDLCTNALPEQISACFSGHPQIHNGEKHGTVGVILDHTPYEITTFRTEGDYTDSRHPDWVRFVSSIEEDLARRDFTVNAMAYNPKTGLVDPWGGAKDLEKGILRCVREPHLRFSEDALRILRGVRFAVRFGLTPEADTLQQMEILSPLLDKLAKERVFDELCKLLPLVNAQDLLRFAPILTRAIPELAPCVGFDQRNPHHIYDVYGHTARAVEAAPNDLSLRWAALLHDIGKPETFTLDEQGIGHFYGHALVSAALADSILRRLKAPNELRERVVFLVEQHMLPLLPERKALLRRMGKYGPDAVRQLLQLQMADRSEPDNALMETKALMEALLAEKACLTVKDLNINGNELMALGIPAGKQIGLLLNGLLEQVQEGLPNERQALLDAVKKHI